MITVYAHAYKIEFVSDLVVLIGWHAFPVEDNGRDWREVRIEATEQDEQDTATQIESVLVALGFKASVTSGDPELDFERELKAAGRRLRLTGSQTWTLGVVARAWRSLSPTEAAAIEAIRESDSVSLRTAKRRVAQCLNRVGRVEIDRLARCLAVPT